MITSNLDRTAEQLNTNAPFMFQCPLDLGGITLPPCAILGLKLYMSSGMTLPARLSELSLDSSGAFLNASFTDAGGSLVGMWRVGCDGISTDSDYVSAFIYDDAGIVSGHITCDKATPSLLVQACRINNGSLKTAVSDFLVLPQCCMSLHKGKAKSFSINGSSTTADVQLTLSRKMQGTLASGAVQLDALGSFECEHWYVPEGSSKVHIGYNGIGSVQFLSDSVLKTYDARGKHLIVKAGVTSNLRVSVQDEALTFSGVTDEQ